MPSAVTSGLSSAHARARLAPCCRVGVGRAALLGLFILWLLACPSALRADDGVPPEVRAAARSGLPEYLRTLPADALPDYGFGSAQELQRAQLGQPYRVHILTPDGLQKATTQHAVEPFLTSTELWIFTVIVDKQPSTLLWVDLTPDGYRAVQLGNSILAQALSQWETRLPPLLHQQGIASFQVRLVQMPQLSTDLLLLTSDKGEHIALLHAPPALSDAAGQEGLSRADHALPVLLSRFRSLTPDPSSGLAPAGGSAVIEETGEPALSMSLLLGIVIATIATACALLWHQRRASHGGTQ